MFAENSKLAQYRIIKQIGSGGMADVYEVEDTRMGRRVALKVLPPEFGRNNDLVVRFEKEVRAAASLNHHGIVTVFDFGHDQGVHFYTMRLLTGGDLRDRINAGLTQLEALSVLREVSDSFDHAHTRGFVHRDVKPENIIFDEQGYPVLTDFGIAKALNSGVRVTATGVSMGTPRYISPEQARGRPVDPRTDLYSLGVILYEMLTGQPPYDGEEALGVIFKHVTEPIPKLPPAHQNLQPLIDKLMAKEPADRPASAGELIKLIDAILPQHPTPESAPNNAPKNITQNKQKTITRRNQFVLAGTNSPLAMDQKDAETLEKQKEAESRQQAELAAQQQAKEEAAQRAAAQQKEIEQANREAAERLKAEDARKTEEARQRKIEADKQREQQAEDLRQKQKEDRLRQEKEASQRQQAENEARLHAEAQMRKADEESRRQADLKKLQEKEEARQLKAEKDAQQKIVQENIKREKEAELSRKRAEADVRRKTEHEATERAKTAQLEADRQKKAAAAQLKKEAEAQKREELIAIQAEKKLARERGNTHHGAGAARKTYAIVAVLLLSGGLVTWRMMVHDRNVAAPSIPSTAPVSPAPSVPATATPQSTSQPAEPTATQAPEIRVTPNNTAGAPATLPADPTPSAKRKSQVKKTLTAGPSPQRLQSVQAKLQPTPSAPATSHQTKIPESGPGLPAPTNVSTSKKQLEPPRATPTPSVPAAQESSKQPSDDSVAKQKEQKTRKRGLEAIMEGSEQGN